MIRLKLVKGTAENIALESQDPGDSHGTRLMKFLVEPWTSSGRVASANSYFASVPCALALKDMGLRFIGVVKTTTKESQNGDCKEAPCAHPMPGHDALAFLWVDRERRCFVSIYCQLLLGEPCARARWRHVEDVATDIDPERLDITIPKTKVY